MGFRTQRGPVQCPPPLSMMMPAVVPVPSRLRVPLPQLGRQGKAVTATQCPAGSHRAVQTVGSAQVKSISQGCAQGSPPRGAAPLALPPGPSFPHHTAAPIAAPAPPPPAGQTERPAKGVSCLGKAQHSTGGGRRTAAAAAARRPATASPHLLGRGLDLLRIGWPCLLPGAAVHSSGCTLRQILSALRLCSPPIA